MDGGRPLHQGGDGVPARVVDGVRQVRRLIVVMVFRVPGGRRGRGVVLSGSGRGAGGADRVAYVESGHQGSGSTKSVVQKRWSAAGARRPG
ncbi:hypothetical protein [Streptomyces laurentii]|uniref:hypothetical protein n=1 Tax=Streptomyces laurentii TaxID=39478 RepID=UPI0033DE2DB5